MSKISLKPNSAGTANFEIAAPATNTDRTFTLPDEAGTVVTTATDLEPQVKDSLNATGTAPIYACRAWVNFSGTGTVSIRDSGNVSSITDNGTGDYTVNFTTAMPDANYSVQGAVAESSNFRRLFNIDDTGFSTSNIRIKCKDAASTNNQANVDNSFMQVAIWR